MIFEGPYEALHGILFETTPGVSEIVEQPLRINERVRGKHLDYTFDLKVAWYSGLVKYFDFKATTDLVQFKNGLSGPAKWESVLEWTKARGIDAEYRTEEELINRKVFIKNWQRMIPAIQQYQKEELPGIALAVEEFMDLTKESSVREITSRLSEYHSTQIQGYIYEQIRQGNLTSDLNRSEFNFDSVILLQRK